MRSNKRIVRSTALAAAVAAACAPISRATVRISEIMVDAPGTNSTQDFIELRSTNANESLNDLTMLFIEGDSNGAAGAAGNIDGFLSFSAMSTGNNGLFLRHSFSTGPSPAIAADTAVQNLGWSHENPSITYL